MMIYQRLSNDERRAYLDNVQLWEAYSDARAESIRLRGSLRWRTVHGHEYLYRIQSARISKSLGVRSEATEHLAVTFAEEKARVTQRIASLRDQVQRQARVCRALDLGRVPRLPAQILRVLSDTGLDRKTLTVIGTHALFAYEALAAVHFPTDLLATRDIDLLWDARSRLRIASAIPSKGLIALLKNHPCGPLAPPSS
ncbi:MAG: GSU2403 family nucleotidyltransferase fold protein [Acidiferrobacter sp.]